MPRIPEAAVFMEAQILGLQNPTGFAADHEKLPSLLQPKSFETKDPRNLPPLTWQWT